MNAMMTNGRTALLVSLALSVPAVLAESVWIEGESPTS
jgi:hypothetical protein